MTANQIAVTEGSGKNVATTTVGGVDFQNVIVAGSVLTISGTSSVSGTVGASIIGQLPAGVQVIGSVVALQGTNPWVVNMPSPSVVSYQLAGSIMAVNMPSSSVISYQLAGSIMSGQVTSIIGAITPYAQPNAYVAQTTSIITISTAVSVLGAPGSNLRNYITNILVTNGSATAAFVTIKDSGASVLASGYAAASGGGFSSSFPVPLRQWTTNASVDVVSSAQASIVATVSGFVAS